MPKEYTHWVIAEEARRRYSGSRVGEALDAARHLFLLGSVLPDIAYYRLLGTGRGRLAQAAFRAHGMRGENTFAFLRRMVSDWGRSLDQPMLALTLGTVCHILTDAAFHPIVYHYTGLPGRHRGALRRHFRFETLLDCHYRAHHPDFPLSEQARTGLLSAVLAAAEAPLEEIARDTVRILFDTPGPVEPRVVAATWRSHALIQTWFVGGRIHGAVRALAYLPIGSMRTLAALLYPKICPSVPFFEGPFEYRHPVTGQRIETSLAALEREVVTGAHVVFSLFESGLPRLHELEALSGPSGHTGLPGKGDEHMRTFAVQDVDTLLGVRPA